MSVKIKGSRVLVTGAARGLGRALTRELVARGAKTVFGGDRDVSQVTEPGVIPVRLDITDPTEVAAAAKACADVDIVINNAGVMSLAPLISSPGVDRARGDMETNFFGTLSMCREFAPILAARGGGALVNIGSLAAWAGNPAVGSYSASKAALWSLTNTIRIELRGQRTLVTGVYAGPIDTPMTAGLDARKISTESVVEQILTGIEAGAEEVLTDERTRAAKANLSQDLTAVYPALQAMWDAGKLSVSSVREQP